MLKLKLFEKVSTHPNWTIASSGFQEKSDAYEYARNNFPGSQSGTIATDVQIVLIDGIFYCVLEQ